MHAICFSFLLIVLPTFLQAKIAFKRHTAGLCYENIQVPCMVQAPSQHPFCVFFPSLCTSERIVPGNCTRSVESCCSGFVLQGGQCVRPSVVRKSSAVCTGQHILRSRVGTIVSPNYPNGYPPNQDCIWQIHGQRGFRIEVRIWNVRLEPPRSLCLGCAPRCIDQVTLFDLSGNPTMTRSYCGTQYNIPAYVSYVGLVYVRFVSDSVGGFSGFSISYNNVGGIATTAIPTTTATTTATTATTTTTTTTTTTALTTQESVTRALSISGFCFGEHVPKNCTTFCNEQCIGGRVVNPACQELGVCLPGCGCPAERPVYQNTRCLTREQCRAQYCSGGMVYTTCMPRCTATCANADNLPTTCQTQADQCISGCKCPDNLPILNEGLCIPRALCPTPTGKFYVFFNSTVNVFGFVHVWLNQFNVENNIYFIKSGLLASGETANEGSWPWATQVYKGIPRTFQCGGTLICSGWVLTAAHCFLSEQGYSLDLQHMNIYLVKIGKFRRSDEPNRQTVSQVPERVVTHPSYDVSQNIHDIALIKLRTPVEMSNTIRPACLPRSSPYLPSMGTSIWGPPFGSLCYVVGWGSTHNRGPTNEYLKQARLQMKLNNVCQRLYMFYQPNINMCVGGDGDDTCRGDSGGPLMCKHGDRWYVDGITSYGRRCGVVGEPGVYTRVTSFSSWVRTITGNTCGHPDTVWSSGTN
ncbi:uncharacterized protein LOC100179458 [Ciona intestinalis]